MFKYKGGRYWLVLSFLILLVSTGYIWKYNQEMIWHQGGGFIGLQIGCICSAMYWWKRAKFFERFAEKVMQTEIAKALRPQLNSEKLQEVLDETRATEAG